MNSPFRDRQILIRSEQGVRHFHLRARHQVLATAACIGLAVWGAGGTATAMLGVAQVRAQQDQIAELTVGYAQVIAGSASHRGEDRSQAGEGGLDVEDSVTDRVLADNARLRDELQAAVADRQRMRTRLAEMEESLEDASGEQATLERELAQLTETAERASRRADALDDELQRKRAEVDRMAELANDQASDVARLETRLSRSREWNAALEAEVGDLTESVNHAVETARAMADERDAALAEVAAVEASRDAARAAALAAIDGADNLRRERDLALTSRDTERARSDRLTGVIEEVVASQQYVFAELRDRTDRQRLELAQGLAATGLDIDRMIDEVWAEMYPGVGGPFLPIGGISFLDASVWSRAEELTESVELTAAAHELATRLPIAMPVRDEHRLSSGFGRRSDPFTGRASGHLGLDFAAPSGTPVYAPAYGTISFAGWRGAYGKMVEVDHGFGVTTRYAHLTHISVQEGQEITTTDELGQVGSTGRSTGPHLHYEIRVDDDAANPEHFLRAGDNVFEITNEE